MGWTDPVPKGTMNARRTAVSASILVLALGLVGCSDDEPSGDATPSADPTSSEPTPPEPTPTGEPTETPTEEPDDEALVLEARIRGGEIEPNAERVEVPIGEEIVLRIDSDAPGELHVHSRPEQFIEFEPGTTTARLTIEAPGLVEVEEHDTGILIWSLQVS